MKLRQVAGKTYSILRKGKPSIVFSAEDGITENEVPDELAARLLGLEVPEIDTKGRVLRYVKRFVQVSGPPPPKEK